MALRSKTTLITAFSSTMHAVTESSQQLSSPCMSRLDTPGMLLIEIRLHVLTRCGSLALPLLGIELGRHALLLTLKAVQAIKGGQNTLLTCSASEESFGMTIKNGRTHGQVPLLQRVGCKPHSSKGEGEHSQAAAAAQGCRALPGH